MDSMDLEREKGITILAKNTAVRYGGVKLNIVDTPGHADFGGEVERGLTMVDGVLLLVDASRGPAAADALRAAQGARGAAAGDPRRQQGRPARRARSPRSSTRSTSCSSTSTPTRSRSSSRSSTATRGPARRRSTPTRSRGDLAPLIDLLVEHIPAPELRPRPPAAGARHEPRRLALRRPARALPRAQRHDPPRASRSPGAAPTARSSGATVGELYVTEALDRVDADEAGPGRDHRRRRASPRSRSARRSPTRDDPRPLPVITVDEPSLSVTIGINTSPLAGQEGAKLTARQVRDRLDAGARRQRLAARPRHRAARRLGGPGPRRAAARGARRADAPRGLRADRRPAAGADARDRRQAARAGRAAGDRRARGLRRRRHPAARAAQGPAGADGQPRHGLGADGVPRPGARADRLPHRVPHRDARHRPPAPRVRPLGAVGRRAAHAPDRLARRRPRAARRPSSR